MDPNTSGWVLIAALALPLVGAALMLLLPKDDEARIKRFAVLVTGVSFALVTAMTLAFDYGRSGELQFVTNVAWIDAINARFHLGIDGISLPLFFLSYLLPFLSAIYTTKHLPEPGKPKAFLSLMLLLQTGMAGTFVAFDLILFFIFFELVLVPMFFMIGMWGGPRRDYASVKFFLYTLFGSIFMLVSFLAVYFQAGIGSWDIVELSNLSMIGSTTFQTWAFLGMFLGFAIKVPMWPFHTWLPDAHTEAPTVGSVLLAGVLLKIGTYGFIRIALPILPDGAPSLRARHRGARRHRHHLRVAVLPRPDRHQAAHRLLVRRTHGLRDARHRRDERGRHPGGAVRQHRARRHHRHAVLPRRVAPRALPHA
jgi:NADH-quinone oxidoreductase subunit M